MPTSKHVFVLLSATLTTACARESPALDDTGITSFDSVDSDDGQDAHLRLDLGSEADLPTQEACASAQVNAKAQSSPVDIIVVVDNSGSMAHEATQVQSHLNGFSNQVIQSGVDPQVVLISSYPGKQNGICIDPPLGGGGCPEHDDDEPRFVHIDQFVDSRNALELILKWAGSWLAWTRPSAATHILVVSDDESKISASSFLADFFALSPYVNDLRFHAVVSVDDCEFSDAVGNIYMELAQMTGGVVGDLCNQDFGPVFDELASNVTTFTLPCEIEIPQPPDGTSFDLDQVTVSFKNGIEEHPIGQVDEYEHCDVVLHGWYYDSQEQPTTIVMCPQTCAAVQDQEQAEWEVVFGCEADFAK